MKKIVAVGEASLDCFNFIHDATVSCNINKQDCQLSISYADKIPSDRLEFSLGGNAANVAVGFARLGQRSSLYSRVGDDWIGEAITTELQKDGVKLEMLERHGGRSSYSTILVFQGERTIISHHEKGEYSIPNLADFDAVYLTSMGESFKSAYEIVLQQVKSNKQTLYFNPGTHQLRAGLVAILPVIKHCQVLFLNKEEAMHLVELGASATIRDIAEALFDYGPKSIVITDAERGAYGFDGEVLLHCPILPTAVVEKTGAGDAFSSAYVYSILRGDDASRALRCGMVNSASVIGKIGAQAGLLNAEDLEDTLEQNKQLVAKQISGR